MEQGLSPVDQKLHTEEVAAWTQVAATMLASDLRLNLTSFRDSRHRSVCQY